MPSRDLESPTPTRAVAVQLCFTERGSNLKMISEEEITRCWKVLSEGKTERQRKARFENAMETKFPPGIDELVRNQYASVKAAHDRVRNWRDEFYMLDLEHNGL